MVCLQIHARAGNTMKAKAAQQTQTLNLFERRENVWSPNHFSGYPDYYFNEVKAQKNHFSSYIQWFEFIEDSAIFKRRVKNKKVNQINARSWRLLTDKPKSRNQF